MSKRSRKTPETEPHETTEASAVELDEGQLDEAAGGWDFKNAWPVQDSPVRVEPDSFVDKTITDMYVRTSKPTGA